ncbi:MAG: NAD-dependent epimerase/dehydratase family protein [Anaerolineae bacterium]|nr:NAD-dependent epimerase/dehydratase family protein [Anaerolineae bacterium]
MKILIIGGTQYIGRDQVEYALAQGHEVTLFNRGKTNPELFPEAEKLRGDRDGDLGALEGRTWDIVIDNCGYVPRVVRQSAELLAGSVGRYVFISTLSVYSDIHETGIDENGNLNVLEDETTEDVSTAYGGLKVLCEKVVQEVYGDRALIIRPGLIVGPHDPTNRFTYWPARVADTSRPEVLAPGNPQDPVQFIDSRDLGRWAVDMAVRGNSGVFNATGPDYRLTMDVVLDTCKQVSGSDVQFTWVSEEFLTQHEVAPYSEMPLWVPSELAGFGSFDVRKAVKAGLTYRPLAETARDTLEWERNRDHAPDEKPRNGMSPEREAELLREWRASQG